MPEFVFDGITFHYEEKGHGQPFVFQHGLGGDVTQPFGLFQPRAGIRSLSLDVRGHGRTTPLGDINQLRFQILAEDLKAWLDSLEIKKAVMGGISMGAAVALHFTLRWPERVIGLVLSRPAWLETPHPWNVKMFTLVASLIRRHGAMEGLQLFQKTPEYLETLQRWPDVATSLSSQFQSPGIEATVEKLERIIRDSPHPDARTWSEVKVPTLVLGNRLDPIHPFEYAAALAQAIPGAQLKEIPSKSESVPRHQAAVQEALDDFLERWRAHPLAP